MYNVHLKYLLLQILRARAISSVQITITTAKFDYLRFLSVCYALIDRFWLSRDTKLGQTFNFSVY